MIHTSTEEIAQCFAGMTKKEKDQARAFLFLEMLMGGNDIDRLKEINEMSVLLKKSRKK